MITISLCDSPPGWELDVALVFSQTQWWCTLLAVQWFLAVGAS